MLTDMLKKAVALVGSLLDKPKFTDVVMMVVGWIPSLINQVGEFGALSDTKKVDEALQAFDAFTGNDPGAIDIVKDLPADQEEALLDYLKEIIRIIAYNRLGVAGYTVNPTPAPTSESAKDPTN